MHPEPLNCASWRKSGRSGAANGGGGNCVEVAGNMPGIVGVRDSKDASGAVLMVHPAAWAAFTTQVKRGTLDS